MIYEFVLTQMVRTTPTPRENQVGRKLHRAILDAITSRDAAAADQAMREHMQTVLKRLSGAKTAHAKRGTRS